VSTKTDYSTWTREELVERVQLLEKRKKYGLVWDEERTREVFEAEAQNSLPVLQEVTESSFVTDPQKPTHVLIEVTISTPSQC